MTDTINEAPEELKGDINVFCEEHDPEKEEAGFRVEVSHNLELISLTTIYGLDDLIEGIEETIKEMDTEALLFFISSGDEADAIEQVQIQAYDEEDDRYYPLVGAISEDGEWIYDTGP